MVGVGVNVVPNTSPGPQAVIELQINATINATAIRLIILPSRFLQSNI
jgi:hypothetical protein